MLPDNPHMGRPGRVPGTREFVIPRTPYIVPYRLQGESIQILRVLSRRAALAGQLLAFPISFFGGPALRPSRSIASRRSQYLAQEYPAQEYPAQDMHVVERIAAAMDVAGASIILGRQCRFSASGTLRHIAIISRSHSVSTV